MVRLPPRKLSHITARGTLAIAHVLERLCQLVSAVRADKTKAQREGLSLPYFWHRANCLVLQSVSAG